MSDPQSTESVLRAIEAEREALTQSVVQLRSELDRAKQRPKIGVPVVSGALVAGFVLAGGLGATLRLAGARERRRRERSERTSLRGLLLGR